MATVMSMPDACYPGCPYAYHYVIEALLQCGMPQEARKLITDYWGSMVKRGADTFWEFFPRVTRAKKTNSKRIFILTS